MVLRVAMSGGRSYAALNPDPGRQRGRGQEMACSCYVAQSDHGDRFGQAISRVCTISMRALTSAGSSGHAVAASRPLTQESRDATVTPRLRG